MFLRFTGQQTAEAAVSELQRMRSLPEYEVGMPELADLSGITGHNLNFDKMRLLAIAANTEGKESGRLKKIAVFAPDPALFGMARMFSTLSELELGNARAAAFQTQSEALEFLGRPEAGFEEIPGYDLVPLA